MDKRKLKQSFKDLGYIIVPEALTTDETHEIQHHGFNLINHWNDDKYIVFNSQSTDHHRHDYFLKSANAIHFFFEQGVFDNNGLLNRPKQVAINKIGHALHRYHPFFKTFCSHPTIQMVADSLDLNPIWVCSMLIFKQPFIGGEVLPHQDASYLYTSPQSLISFWFALEDATEENGCLWILPGGHKMELKYRSFLNAQKEFVKDVYDDTQWALDNFIPIPVKKGSLIVFDGMLPHYSRANHSCHSRHTYILQGFDQRSLYAEDNWIPLPEETN